MNALIQGIAAALQSGKPVALSTVVGRRGSLPMGRRAKMLVGADGTAVGTIGGGCLEAEVYAHASELLRGSGARIDDFNLTEVEDGLLGHICGGSVSILTEVLEPTPSTQRLFERLRESTLQRRPAVLVSKLPAVDGRQPGTPDHLLVYADGTSMIDGSGAVPDGFIGRCLQVLSTGLPAQVSLDVNDLSADYFVEPIVPRPTAVIFGAGHCGVAIGELATTVGFRTVILDDRIAFLDPTRLPWAAVIRQVDFTAALDAVDIGPDPYLVIVTRGHDHDLTVLRQVLSLPNSYLGMIGSARKKHLFRRQLLAEGIAAEQLDGLRSPMGLAIGADTPEEIAVSVVGEMIAVRRRALEHIEGTARQLQAATAKLA